MSNGKKSKKRVTKESYNTISKRERAIKYNKFKREKLQEVRKPGFFKIPDDLPPKDAENLTHREIRRSREYKLKKANPGKFDRAVIKTIDSGVNAVKKHITEPIAKKRAAAKKERETNARAKRDAQYGSVSESVRRSTAKKNAELRNKKKK